MSSVYKDDHKEEDDPDTCTNLVAMRVLGRIMLDVYRPQSSLDYFSRARISDKHKTIIVESTKSHIKNYTQHFEYDL